MFGFKFYFDYRKSKAGQFGIFWKTKNQRKHEKSYEIRQTNGGFEIKVVMYES